MKAHPYDEKERIPVVWTVPISYDLVLGRGGKRGLTCGEVSISGNSASGALIGLGREQAAY
jgi:hypothetical protein